jgi:hypothetical protein
VWLATFTENSFFLSRSPAGVESSTRLRDSVVQGDFMVTSNGLYQSAHNFETSIRVKDALLRVNQLRFSSLSVNAFCGIVELTGVLSNYFDKAQAMRIAGKVDGVSTVVESIQIRPNRGIPHPMEERCRSQFQFRFPLPHGRGTGTLD